MIKKVHMQRGIINILLFILKITKLGKQQQ